jgi:hypothetical protein
LLVGHYTQHCGVTLLTGVAAPVSHLVGQAGGYVALSSRRAIHNFRSYLFDGMEVVDADVATTIIAGSRTYDQTGHGHVSAHADKSAVTGTEGFLVCCHGPSGTLAVL